MLLIVYGGPSVAALLVLLMGVAIARTRTEVMVVAAISARWCWCTRESWCSWPAWARCGWATASIRCWSQAAVLMALAGAATVLYLRRQGRLEPLNGDTR